MSSAVDVADFMLYLRSQAVPQSICQNVISVMKDFGSQVAKQALERVCKGGCALNSESVSTLPAMSTLNMIDSSHKLNKFATHERGYIAPETLKGNMNCANWRSPQYVPIEQQLRQVLSSDEYSAGINFSPKASGGKMYASMFDGAEHQDPANDTLYLVLYYDEFVVSNPLRNKTPKYSIGAIYYSIANMKQRSRLNNIFLAMLFPSSFQKQHSWKTLLHCSH